MDKELDEALKCAEMQCSHPDDSYCTLRAGEVLAAAYRSSLSTIRAQEEEIAGLKKIAATYLAQQCDFAHDSAENFRRAEFAEKRADSNFEDLEVVRERSKTEFSKYIEAMKEYHLRAEASEAKVLELQQFNETLKSRIRNLEGRS